MDVGRDGRKRVSRIRLAAAPLIGAQFTVPPFPQNGTGGFFGATVNVGAGVSMSLIADPSDWDKTQHGHRFGPVGLAEESALERSTGRLARRYAA